MVKRISLILAFAVLAASLPACMPARPDASFGASQAGPASSSQSAGSHAPAPDAQAMAFKPADGLRPDVSAALSGFSVDLFKRVAACDKGRNVFLSPVSIWLALSMTYNGTSGETAGGMAEALHASGISLEDLNRDNAGLMGVLVAADPKTQVAIANSIWIRDSFFPSVNESFLDENRNHYAAAVEPLDFSSADAAGVINRWVEDNTGGNIRELVESPIDFDTVMFLINAVHFKAPWKVAFDPKDTRKGHFRLAGGTDAPVEYLYRGSGNLGYMDERVIAARIPYASGRLEMAAVMPLRESLADFVKDLTAEKVDSYIRTCGESEMPLLFPKFQSEYEILLNDTLKQMGMEAAFDPAWADFTALSASCGRELYISKVKHKSFIEVNEEGAEASAATSVEIKRESAMTELKFDRPFLYLIRDTSTGAILFIGTMEDPS